MKQDIKLLSTRTAMSCERRYVVTKCYKTDEKDMVHSRPSPELAYETHDSSSSTYIHPIWTQIQNTFYCSYIAIPILCHFQIQRNNVGVIA